MPFTVSPAAPAPQAPAPPPFLVEADEHVVKGAFHVFRRSAVVVGRPRTVVALRLPLADVQRVDRA